MTASPPVYPPMAPPRSYRHVWVVVGICVAALLLVLSLPVFGFVVWLTAGPDIDEPRTAADRFVQQLERNDDGDAHRSMCPEVRDRVTAAEFTAAVERLGRPVSHTLGNAGFADEPGNSAFVTVNLTDSSGRTSPITLHLESDPGWQVCGDTFG